MASLPWSSLHCMLWWQAVVIPACENKLLQDHTGNYTPLYT